VIGVFAAALERGWRPLGGNPIKFDGGYQLISTSSPHLDAILPSGVSRRPQQHRTHPKQTAFDLAGGSIKHYAYG